VVLVFFVADPLNFVWLVQGRGWDYRFRRSNKPPAYVGGLLEWVKRRG